MNQANVQKLRSPLAIALIDYVFHSVEATFARVDAISADGSADVVDLTIEAQLPQDRVVKIADAEPIRLVFSEDDRRPPSVFSRREDFPIDLVHTNLDRDTNGMCLCIWEESWHNLKRSLTPQALVERLRDWLTRTARGALHQEGQPLEPLIPAVSDTLVVPAGPPPANWFLTSLYRRESASTAIVESERQERASGVSPIPIFSLTLPPQIHGALHKRPHDLEGFCQLSHDLGLDLPKVLGDWLTEGDQLKANDRHPLFIVTVPKRRDLDEDTESFENWAFMPAATLGQLGEALGRTFDSPSSKLSSLRIPRGPLQDLSSIFLFGWRVVQRPTRKYARRFAGNPATTDHKLVATGAGAIGSNIILNSVRAGVGTWTIIDDDIVLPHNIVRQTQINSMIGLPKSERLSVLANSILAEGGCVGVVADILDPGEAVDEIADALSASDLVVDFSASPAVLGHFADNTGIKRAASFFFNPNGHDLVVLAEDAMRSLKIDEIEAQYFLAVACDGQLAGHLASARVDFIRYANACQDLSRPLPPWQVQTLCGIGAGRLLPLLESPLPVAQVWRLNNETGAVFAVPISVVPTRRLQLDGWQISVAHTVVSQMRQLRTKAAPKETGGVLVGSFDLSRKIVHIVAALSAPPDSQQAPTYFIRGRKYLKPLIDEISTRSAGVLVYVGEWHSHPDRAASRPSGDDENVYRYLEEHLAPTGAPYIMAICGKKETWLRAGWQPVPTGEAIIRHER